MAFRDIAVCIVVLTALTGCATDARPRSANLATLQKAAEAEIEPCLATAYNDPKYADIKSHISSPQNGFQPTMSQLNDETYPTKHESALLIKYRNEILPCRQASLAKVQTVNPRVAQAIAEEWAAADQITMELIKRKITWGESNQQVQQAVSMALLQWTVHQQIIDNANQQAK